MLRRCLQPLWGLALAAGVGLQAMAAVVIVDDQGQRVGFEKPPQRIVSLLPSLTESVCALDACDRLVAVDRYSDFPSSVQGLPVAGGGLDPHIEAVVALKPDLVLMSVSSRASQRLQALGLKVVTLEPQNQADVKRVLGVLDTILYGDQDAAAETSRADTLWQSIEQGLDQAAASLPAQSQGMRVYFEVNHGSYGAAPSSFLGEILSRLGLINVLPLDFGPFPRVTPEYIVRSDPDVLMVTNSSEAPPLQYPGWQNMRAMKAKYVCQFDAEDSNILVRAGPRMHVGAQLIANCLQVLFAPSGPASVETAAAISP